MGDKIIQNPGTGVCRVDLVFFDLREMSRPPPRLGERTILSIMYCHLKSQMLLAAPACGGEISSAGSLLVFPLRRYWSTPFHTLCFACLCFSRGKVILHDLFSQPPNKPQALGECYGEHLDAIARNDSRPLLVPRHMVFDE